MMTLDEAIKHCEEVAEKNDKIADAYKNGLGIDVDCRKCAEEHRQLASWLRELKAYKDIRRILSQNRITTDRYDDVVLWDDIKRVFEEVNADGKNTNSD